MGFAPRLLVKDFISAGAESSRAPEAFDRRADVLGAQKHLGPTATGTGAVDDVDLEDFQRISLILLINIYIYIFNIYYSLIAFSIILIHYIVVHHWCYRDMFTDFTSFHVTP